MIVSTKRIWDELRVPPSGYQLNAAEAACSRTSATPSPTAPSAPTAAFTSPTGSPPARAGSSARSAKEFRDDIRAEHADLGPKLKQHQARIAEVAAPATDLQANEALLEALPQLLRFDATRLPEPAQRRRYDAFGFAAARSASGVPSRWRSQPGTAKRAWTL
ncbi:hypothetical protein [Streptacidiphilus sp. P02-A3a]|uniref:hypothetical protein n=1 Tax=Streptacidiphilus sp. P02-A3a TaxID=2704468 RepID=UPI0015FA1103|nr:hypothetical protein [Streptacidiphilus sp. P02-A3a]QMU72542.1 hypothetical protein GXP74_34140 [Streptacidiphilus sp. P02-A3a]